MKLLFSIPTLKPSLEEILISTISDVISLSSLPKFIIIVPFFCKVAISSELNDSNFAWKSLINDPNNFPTTLKFGLTERFIYSFRSSTNSISLIFNSS